MVEVALQNGTGQAAKLGTLADKINAEHRACVTAAADALAHALAAGDLLAQAKAEQGHGSWLAWLEDNFEGTPRTAQVYMRLARKRKLVEELKAKSASHLSIAGAMQHLAPQAFDVPPVPHPAPLPRPPDQEAVERAKAAKEQRLMRKAEFALRTGSLEPPADLTNEEAKGWQSAVYRAQIVREENLPTALDLLGNQLHILSENASPEKVARYLLGRVGYEEAETVTSVLAELRAGLPWLQRVLEVAEQEQRP